jgi:PAS domain S-box-containing protein
VTAPDPQTENRDLASLLVETTPDAVIVADKEGVIRLWNRGAEAIFGYSSAEALGQTLDLIVPERFRQRHWQGYRQVMATGLTRYTKELLAVPAMRRDGTRISLEFSVALLHDAAGALIGIGAIMRDVTERWERDRALQREMAELRAAAGSSAEGSTS